MENTERAKFEIPEHRMGELKDKIADLNKKAAKVGCPEIKIIVGDHFDRTYREHPYTGHELIEPMVIRFFNVEFEGLEPKFSGWTFIARIDHEPEGNIINAIPGIELDPRYRTSGAICEHCKIKRYRKSSFVVRHEDGTEKQVGSSCLKDFLGHGTPERIAWYCESLFSFVRGMSDEEFRFGGKIEERYNLVSVLTLTVATIRKYGWLSATKAKEIGGYPTADYLRTALCGRDKYADETRREIREVAEAGDKDFAENALAWVKGMTGELNDYFYNLKTVCGNGTIELKRVGIVASLIPVYRREVEGAIERARTVKEPSSWIGHPDTGRMTVKGVKVVGYSTIEGYAGGSTHIYRFLANGKDKLTWFASSNQYLDLETIVDITFSVKKLDEYKGEHQTIITRAKFTVIKAPETKTE